MCINSIEWKVYQVTLTRDMESQIGVKESLSFVAINETVPSYNQRQLNMPPLTLEIGVYK